jgi:hypothetical protein
MIKRKYNFQAGTKISSNQMDEELDNLIAGVNNLEQSKETPSGAQEKADAAKTEAITEAVNASVQHIAGTKKKMLQDYSTGTITVPPNSYALAVVTFSQAFVESPTIADSMISSQSGKNCSVALGVKTTTNVNVWVYNDHPTETRYIIVSLLVFGTKAL